MRSTGWLPAFPRSAYKQEPWGLGNYTLTLKVSEFDEFGESVSGAGEVAEEGREAIVERVVERLRAED